MMADAHTESSFTTVSVIGLPVAVTTYAGAIDWIKSTARQADRAYAVEAANTHVAALARHDTAFGQAMAKFDLICPDGMPLGPPPEAEPGIIVPGGHEAASGELWTPDGAGATSGEKSKLLTPD